MSDFVMTPPPILKKYPQNLHTPNIIQFSEKKTKTKKKTY